MSHSISAFYLSKNIKENVIRIMCRKWITHRRPGFAYPSILLVLKVLIGYDYDQDDQAR